MHDRQNRNGSYTWPIYMHMVLIGLICKARNIYEIFVHNLLASSYSDVRHMHLKCVYIISLIPNLQHVQLVLLTWLMQVTMKTYNPALLALFPGLLWSLSTLQAMGGYLNSLIQFSYDIMFTKTFWYNFQLFFKIMMLRGERGIGPWC